MSNMKTPRSASTYRAARRPEMILRGKARGKAALLKERASDFTPQKPWKWQRATPRAS